LVDEPDGASIDPSVAARVREAFDTSPFHGLFHLGAVEVDTTLPASLAFGRSFGKLFVASLCAQSDLDGKREAFVSSFPEAEASELALSIPPMPGGEYLRIEVLRSWWRELETVARSLLVRHTGPVQALLRSWNPIWSLVGRVWFHLAENKRHPSAPFAFMATYTKGVGDGTQPRHVPLARALEEYAGQRERDRLLALLAPVHRASETSEVARRLVDSGEVFHPLAWSPPEALAFLHDIPQFEAAGVLVRVPDWWNTKRPPRPSVKVTLGSRTPSRVGVGAMLDFAVEATIDGEPITSEEWGSILRGTDGLVLLKGKWVEVEREKLEAVLAQWRRLEQRAEHEGIGFLAALRLLAGKGTDLSGGSEGEDGADVEAGPWLAEVLDRLRSPAPKRRSASPKGLNASLRPYQHVGVQWLRTVTSLGLGGCLADDMGLGKTMQVLALLLDLERDPHAAPNLLVAPASLLGNWKAEIERFAPNLVFRIAHASATPTERIETAGLSELRGVDLVMTTYASVHRLPWLKNVPWNIVVLDEAQAIKNPGAKQTRAVKAIPARSRLCLTGTPIENRLTDLWSLFDFLLPGLLGSTKSFAERTKRMERKGSYAPLRRLVGPYILRRLKTDPTVIDDLPDKTEMTVRCPLTREQAVLYQNAVDELAARLEEADGMARRGLILAFLMRFKQICNHPAHWLGHGEWKRDGSGKLLELAQIGEQIRDRQEKLLVFTQFREATRPLEQHLANVFGRNGLVLHGQVAVGKRKGLVDAFQHEDGPPFFVLSLKAGGTGLNLTAASHVVHFDRWWNPAVENQATDRAFRIGQKKNVLVHKLVCRGTIEERIDQLIESKRALASEVVADGAEKLLTEMSNDEILRLVSLDLNRAGMNGD
jgi:non-specific serine/threonine protein kinase